MTDKEKSIVSLLIEKLPLMSERDRGYLEGTIATAAAMGAKPEDTDAKVDKIEN